MLANIGGSSQVLAYFHIQIHVFHLIQFTLEIYIMPYGYDENWNMCIRQAFIGLHRPTIICQMSTSWAFAIGVGWLKMSTLSWIMNLGKVHLRGGGELVWRGDWRWGRAAGREKYFSSAHNLYETWSPISCIRELGKTSRVQRLYFYQITTTTWTLMVVLLNIHNLFFYCSTAKLIFVSLY